MREGWTYDDLVAEALAAPFSGWDFSFLQGRVRDCELPWSYEDLARSEIATSERMLDLDTGGGEALAALLDGVERPAGATTVATEAWEPNVPVARKRLVPLGVDVRQSRSNDDLPAADAEFDLVLNRHGGCAPSELRRIIAAGGIYFTQGVGSRNDIEFNTELGGPAPTYAETATRDHVVETLEAHGFDIVQDAETFAEFAFFDIGAVVFQLSVVSWQLPGFDVVTYDRALRELDARIRREGQFTVRHHRLMVKAVRHGSNAP